LRRVPQGIGFTGLLGSKAPQQMGSWKKRLPTIVEGIEDLEEVHCLATTTLAESWHTSTSSRAIAGLPESLTDPLSIISNADCAAAVLQRLRDGSRAERRQLFIWLMKALPRLAISEAGCEVVTTALDVATGADRTMIASAFHGSVLNLCTSPHGNKVLVTLVQSMSVSSIEFVADEIAGCCARIARDRFGSLVLEAMTMHCSEDQVATLAAELVDDAVELSRHPHSSSFIQNLLEYGPPKCRKAIAERLIPEAPSLAMHHRGRFVVEKAFQHCEDEDHQAMAEAFLQAASPSAVPDVACSRHGSSILEEIAWSDVHTSAIRAKLSMALLRLGKSKYGRRVMVHFGLAP